MRTGFRLIAINIVVLAVLAELAALAWHFVTHGELYYTRTKPPSSTVAAAPATLTTFRVSPYFGFMRAPGLPLLEVVSAERLADLAAPERTPTWTAVATNNYGFLSPHDFPLASTLGNPFVIGVFGGSVAQWFALQAAAALTRDLRDVAALRNRDIVVLNFAAGGYKQPQQLLALNYFMALGQRFDFVINLDGFNEIALARHNLAAGIAVGMPSIEHMAPLARLAPLVGGGDGADAVAQLALLKRQTADLTATAPRQPLALGYLADTLRLRQLTREAAEIAATLAAAPPAAARSLIALTPAAPGTAGSGDAAIALWSASSRQMNDLLRSRGIPFLQVVQPNQYFGAHPFGTAEAALAVREDSPYRAHVRAGYPLLLAALPALRGSGIAVLDATSLFDIEASAVYADDCCHYNQRGNDLLARAIATAMIAAIERPPRLPIAAR